MKKNGVKLLAILSLTIVLAFSLVACGNKDSKDIDKEAEGGAAINLDYDQEEITISGLEEAKDVKIKIADLRKMTSKTVKAEGKTNDGEKVHVNATGPTLDTVLEKYNKKQTDYNNIRFVASDGYEIAIPKDMLEKREIILAYLDDNKPLDEESKPLHMVIPGERSMYWLRMMDKIILESDESAAAVDKIVFIENAVKNLKTEAYKDEFEKDNDGKPDAVKNADLISKYCDKSEAVKQVDLKAKDGLEKNESAETFAAAYIKYRGADTPKYVAPEMPKGMRVRGLLSAQYGNVSFYSLTSAEEALKQQEHSFKAIAKNAGLNKKDNYEFINNADESVILDQEAANNAIIKKAEGSWVLSYQKDGADKILKDITEIIAK